MPNSAESSQKQYQNKTLTPVTIKQLQSVVDSSGDTMILDNHTLDRISFVGVIRNIQKQATNTHYTIEDGTGSIEVTDWNKQQQNDDMEVDDNTIDTGKYVSVIGSLRNFNNRRSVNPNRIRPITNHNEVVYHLLKSLSIHLQATGKAGGGQQQVTNGGGEDSLFVDGNNSLRDRVYKAIAAFKGETGIHVETLIQQLNIGYNELLNEIGQLSDAGQIYETDEHCYMAAV
jgi:replication factor A2